MNSARQPFRLPPWLWPFRRAGGVGVATTQAAVATPPMPVRPLPTPALRWVSDGRIALRTFDFDADAEAVSAFQAETYEFNFPGFRYTPEFAQAFRYDLRRASLDPQHGLFVLDERRLGEDSPPPGLSPILRGGMSASGATTSGVCGFLWVVVCQNTWTGERYGYVNNLYITKDRRGRRLGRELLGQADTFFRSRGIRRVRLTVSSHNAAAVQLYKGSGYDVTRWEMEKEI